MCSAYSASRCWRPRRWPPPAPRTAEVSVSTLASAVMCARGSMRWWPLWRAGSVRRHACRPCLHRVNWTAQQLGAGRRVCWGGSAEETRPTMATVKLADFAGLSASYRENGRCFERFRAHPMVSSLQWPDDVIEQFLYDHGNNDDFLCDYGDVELAHIKWDVEILAVEEFLDMPTGPSDRGCIEEFAENPGHWVRVRDRGIHVGVAQCWEVHGTWKRWPILIERRLLDPFQNGLQVVEGRTRVGVLRGFHRQGTFVAERHLAWVGRSST